MILALIVGAGCLLIFGFQRLISPERRLKHRDPAASASPAAAPADPGSVLPPVPVSTGTTEQARAAEAAAATGAAIVGGGDIHGVVEAAGFYVFLNRTVPEPPFRREASTLGTARDSRGFQLSTDEPSNAWVMRGPPMEVEQFKLLAKSLDVSQDELDLDFVLLSVSEDWLKSWGISIMFQDGASWASMLHLDTTAGTLRFASQAVSIDATLANSTSAVRLVSSPVVRCLTGEKWKFSADSQVPVPSLTRSEGVVSTAYEYKPVGLGLEGIARRLGVSSYKIEVEQRNGSVEPSSEAQNGSPPQLREQVLKTTLVAQTGQWSCVGGVRSWRIEKRKRILGTEEREEEDLLLIFLRPRRSLDGDLRRFPVEQQRVHLGDYGPEVFDIPADQNPLLPPEPARSGKAAPWQLQEREFIEKRQAAEEKPEKPKRRPFARAGSK